MTLMLHVLMCPIPVIASNVLVAFSNRIRPTLDLFIRSSQLKWCPCTDLMKTRNRKVGCLSFSLAIVELYEIVILW